MKSVRGQPKRIYRMAARAEAAEATGERILGSAQELFAEALFDQVSLAAVAKRAGVTVQTVIRRFGTKEDLFASTGRWRSERIRSARDKAPPGDVAAAITNLFDSYERWGDEQLHLLAQERRAEAIAGVVDAGRRYHHRWVERVFAEWLSGLPSSLRKRRSAQLVALTDVYVWKVLRRDLGLTRQESEAAMGEIVTLLAARA